MNSAKPMRIKIKLIKILIIVSVNFPLKKLKINKHLNEITQVLKLSLIKLKIFSKKLWIKKIILIRLQKSDWIYLKLIQILKKKV